MKVLRGLLAIAGGVVLLIVCTVLGWLYLYTADLPPITDLYQYDPATSTDLLSDVPPRSQMYSWQLARELAVNGDSPERQIDRLRLADRIQRHFSQLQVMTIYLNRVYLGENSLWDRGCVEAILRKARVRSVARRSGPPFRADSVAQP